MCPGHTPHITREYSVRMGFQGTHQAVPRLRRHRVRYTTTPKGPGMDKTTPKGRFPLRWVAASALAGAVAGTFGIAAAQTDTSTTSTTAAAADSTTTTAAPETTTTAAPETTTTTAAPAPTATTAAPAPTTTAPAQSSG